MGLVILNRLSSPSSITYETVEATIESTNWEASGISGVVKNDVVFGSVTSSQQEEEYGFAFNINEVVGNDFANLPQDIDIIFSSASTTEPVTVTKTAGGGFTDKFIGSFMLVFQPSGPPVAYVPTTIIDPDTMTCVYFTEANQNNQTLSSLTNKFGGPNNNVSWQFAALNGTPDPQVAALQTGFGFDEENDRTYNKAGAIKGGSMAEYFQIPANAASIADFRELTPGYSIPVGIRYYALIFDNIAAYVCNAQGVRKITKIEGGNTFINVAVNYGDEDWSQAGGDLQFITPFAIETVSANRVNSNQWAEATEFPSIDNFSEVTVAVGLDVPNEGNQARSHGLALTYNIETPSGDVFGTDNFLVLELNMDETTIGDAADIETAWANIKYYEVLGNNEIRFFAPANSVTDVPIIAKVIK